MCIEGSQCCSWCAHCCQSLSFTFKVNFLRVRFFWADLGPCCFFPFSMNKQNNLGVFKLNMEGKAVDLGSQCCLTSCLLF